MIHSSYAFLPLEKISRHLLNLDAPPVSQEGEETAYVNYNWLAKT